MRRITRPSTALIGAAALLGLLSVNSAVRADDSVGSVTQVSGSAQIQRGGATLAAQQGTPVKLHDEVTTQPGASVTLGFADGSSIALSGNTSIAIEDSAMVNGQTVPSRVTLINGDIHTIVPDKTTGQQHSIEVNTANSKATGPAPNQ
ncbi:FecR domain-containing protein [Candidatus Binatus sp.]|uniref:FecR domain-containing protein n=2 Tax=Candidatus Binatus sp. TaxID=2811406 RepID=UPI003C9081BA